MKKVLIYTVFWSLFFFASVGAACAEGANSSHLTLFLENDAFADKYQDMYYTHGTRFSFISKDDPEIAGKLSRYVFPVNQPGYKKNYGLAIGQEIYTPENIKRKDLIRNDRPYAGWFYVAGSLHSKSEKNLNSVELSIGMIGPDSFAEDTQKSVHSFGHWGQPQGWENQLNNELGFMVQYEHKRKESFYVGAVEIDEIPMAGLSLGTVLTSLELGNQIRAGYNLPNDFGISRSRNIITSEETVPRHGWGIYVTGGVNGRYVVRNIFLDGNTFSSSHRVAKEPFVADIDVGLAIIRHSSFELSYKYIVRTREFKEQKANSKFGSIALNFIF